MDASSSLDRMERQLALAEFTKNRQFIAWALPSAAVELGEIAPDYQEPLGNWWGDIPAGFKQLKETAQRAIVNVEGIFYLLDEVRAATDPEVAARAMREIRYNCRGGDRHWRISLPDDLESEEFFRVCQRHKVMVDRLRDDGLLDAFIRMRADLQQHIWNFIEPYLPLGRTVLHRFTIHYHPDTLVIEGVDSRLEDLASYLGKPVVFNVWHRVEEAEDFEEEAVEQAAPGRIDYHWLPGRYAHTGRETWFQTHRDADFRFYNDCLDTIFALRYGEPHELVKRPRTR